MCADIQYGPLVHPNPKPAVRVSHIPSTPHEPIHSQPHPFYNSRAIIINRGDATCKLIQVCFFRRGKTRLAKWYAPYNDEEKIKLKGEVCLTHTQSAPPVLLLSHSASRSTASSRPETRSTNQTSSSFGTTRSCTGDMPGSSSVCVSTRMTTS